MVKRGMRCIDCGYEWTSKADNPRCSKCGSRNVEEVKDTTISQPQGEADSSKIFSAFDGGTTLIEVVKQGLCDPDTAEELWNKYEKLKEMSLEVKERPKLEIRIEDLEERLSKVEGNLAEILEVTTLGKWVKEDCEHYRDGYCRVIYWDEEQKGTFVLRSIEEDGKWHIDPNERHCALCPKNTISNTVSQKDIDKLRRELSSLKVNICPTCGKPAVVLSAKCTSCGAPVDVNLRA